MRTWQIWVGLIFIVLALASCASWQAAYLKEAANHATMGEVENHLGQPHSTWDLRTGETLWTYQSGVSPGTDSGGVTIVGPGWVIGRRSDCTAYVLLFDQQKVLRAWMRQPCKPDRPVSRTSTDQACLASLHHEPCSHRARDHKNRLGPRQCVALGATAVACARHPPVVAASHLGRGS
jgi:hypothetical protein